MKRAGLLLLILTMFATVLPAAAAPPGEVRDEWRRTWAIFCSDPAIAEAIVWPEVQRYSAIRDAAETAADYGAGILGTATPDYSIGIFQMRPSFVADLEKAWMRSGLAAEYDLAFDVSDNADVRRRRIDRMTSYEWQVLYVGVFLRLLYHCYKLENLSVEEQVRLAATAYNRGCAWTEAGRGSVEALRKYSGSRYANLAWEHYKAIRPPVPDTGLPVVFIDTEGHWPAESRSRGQRAVISVRGAGGHEGLEPVSCIVRGRGNTSWRWPKKPCSIDFRGREQLLGMPASRHWVLLANYPDRTLMRNLVAMKVSSMTSLSWTPRCVPVELVMNGRHEGSYLLAEKVEVDADRVNVPGYGGLLLELDFRRDGKLQWTDSHGMSSNSLGVPSPGIPFAVRYPPQQELGPEGEAAVRQYVSDVAAVLYSDGFADPQTGYARYLDVDSFVDYWLVFELLGNPELANPASVFFHKGAGGKLTAGPCWDFDCSLRAFGTTVQELTGYMNRHAIWYARLFQDPAFERKVRQRIMELMPQLETIPGYIDELRQLLEASAELNFAMWNPGTDRWQNKGLLINGDENLDFDEAVRRLKQVYLRRLELLKKF